MQASQDGWITVGSSDKKCSTGRRNGKQLQYPCCKNPTKGMKRQKDVTAKDKAPREKDVQYATGEEQRAITTSSRSNEMAGPKWKRRLVSGGENQV